VTIAVVLLAAGRSSRFGGAKLAADLGGSALALHPAETLARLDIALRIAVVSSETPSLAALGFDCVMLEPVGAPLSQSLRHGVAQAVANGASAVLVALADMPLIPLAHFQALLNGYAGLADGNGIATRANAIAMPPAVFGPGLLAGLQNRDGDRGARSLLKDLPTIELAPDLAIDVDTPADLARAEQLLAAR
jgi:molybdenum cofactor cytidylyltransferase